MGADNPEYANNSQRCRREAEIMEVHCQYLYADRGLLAKSIQCESGLLFGNRDESMPMCADEEYVLNLPQVIGSWVAERQMEEVLAAMKIARVPAGPILSTAQIVAEEQYQQRGMFHRARPPSGEQGLTMSRA